MFRKNLIFCLLILFPIISLGQLRGVKLNVDNVQIDGNTISTTDTNGDLTFDMNGTGRPLFADLTATTVPYLDGSKKIQSSAVTPTELGYLTGVTSALQTQINAKAPSASPTFTGTITTPLTASRACIINGSQQLAVSSVTDTELGYLSGVTSAVQTQLNNKMTSPLTTTGDMIYSSSGSTAARLAVGLNSQVLKVVAGVPSWANFSGGINYVTDTDGSAIGSWVTYADAAATNPVDMTGGSPSSTFATSSDSSLRGSTNFLWTHSAANRQGEGFSYNFTIDPSDKGKVLQITFEYLVASGTYADDDLQCWIYDRTNSALIQPAPYKLKNSTIVEKAFMEFQTVSSSTSYRFGCHVATTTATAYTVRFGNWIVGPQGKFYGSPITDWVSTPVPSSAISNMTQNGYMWKRVGDEAVIQLSGTFSGAGSLGSLTPAQILPSGLSLDTTKIMAFAAGANNDVASVGTHAVVDAGVVYYTGVVTYDKTANTFFLLSEASGSPPITPNTTDGMAILIRVPILGWGSTQISSSESADSRVVMAQASGNPASASSGNPIIFPTANFDTHSAYNASTGRFTCPTNQYYKIYGALFSANTNISIQIYKDAVAQTFIGVTDSNGDGEFTGSVQCNAGQIIDIRPDNTIDASSGSINFEKIQSPQQVLATESVSAKYRSTAANNLVTDTIIDFATKDWDSHNSVTTGASWKFTAPVSGEYVTCTNYFLAGATAAAIGSFVGATLRKNGAASGDFIAGDYVRTTSSITKKFNGCSSIKLLAGEYIDLRGYNDTGQTHAAQTTAGMNYIEIRRVGNY